MNRLSLRRADSSRQLDLFSFVPPVLPRRQPAPEEAPVVLPFPDRFIPPEPRPTDPNPILAVPETAPFRILDRHKVGQGSLVQKCRDNLAALTLVKRLESEGRPAIHDERAVLVRYVGWGGLPQVFDERNPNWTRERADLRRLLSDDEFRSARSSTLNAHYTAAPVIRAMYAALEQFGFAGGQVLEPACGLGHFLGLMPEAMRERSTFTGIELDGLTTRLARALYPEADLRDSPFEEARLQADSFDLAVSNVPFGDYRPFDPRFPRLLIHDYFFAAALDWVRPGGLIAFITSRGTLDKQDATLRDLVAAQADLLGAIRLPNTAFKENANTEVTTDIVFLRKRLPGEAPSGSPWRELAPIRNSVGDTIPVNEYFAAHPDRMLGEMRLTGRMYRQQEPTLVPNARDLSEQLAEVIRQLPSDCYRPADPTPAVSPAVYIEAPPAPETVKPHAFTLVQGRLARREGDTLVLLSSLSETAAQRLRGLIRVRDELRHCLQTQWQDQPEDDQLSARAALNQAYDTFVTRFGPLSGRANVSAFRGDPDLPLLLSLEHFDRESGTATKAAIFRERTIAPRPPAPEIRDARSALLVTLAERGRVDLEHLSRLLHLDEADALRELQGVVFLNPTTQAWETDDEYLSGNVREKLRAAEAAARLGARFAPNVEALRSVQPEDLSPTDIDARLGSAWIPASDLAAFAETLLGERGVEITHSDLIGSWAVKGSWNVRIAVANTTEWGTDRRSALDLLEDALNLRTPTIYDQDPVNDRMIVNGPATEAARDRQQKMKDRFQAWLWEDDARRERLCRLYNDRFNAIRLRTFNGDHLHLPGASHAVVLRPHQKAAVWRILQTPNTLLAHVVGAGKTYTMVAAAMELKRLGLARKPLFVVPNHMLEQFSSELLTLYPAANILVASKEDFEKERRQTLMSRIATGNWDAVIVTHSGFERIPLSQGTQEAFFTEQIEALENAITEQQREDRGSRIVKELEKAKKRLETRLKELLAEGRKDDGLTFEQLGVDRLFVDEAHHFKNLFYVSKMTRIAGLPQTASQRALDMFLKVRHLQQAHGGGVVFATGTPIANSVAEMFTMQRYLQLTAMQELKIDHFDAWAGTFGEPVTAMELSPDGSGYRLNTRFARFINVPELMAQFRQVADILTAAMLQLPVPALRGGKPTIISAPCSPELKRIVEGLVQRADRLRTGRVKPNEDNMLLVTSDGRKAALDLRLIDPTLPDLPDSKVNRAVAEVERIWRETTEQRSVQLVFCDLSIPGPCFSVYTDMRDKLVARSVPLDEIAFIQDFDSDAAKAALFRDVREGRVRILFGSTAKMGSGTNVQRRLIALHHLDAPWRPADVEQREGRILRQGNQNPDVQICRYVTAESFDAYMWQCLETKAKFIAQVMSGDTSLRRLEDVDGAALTYAEVKAIASGNPLVIEKANVDAELARLTRLRTQHRETGYRIRNQVRHLSEEIPRLERRLTALDADLARRQDTRGDRFTITLGTQDLSDRGVAGEMLIRVAERSKDLAAERRLGRFAGFDLLIGPLPSGETELLLRGNATHTCRVHATAHGTTRALEHVVNYLEDTRTQLADHLAQVQRRLADLRVQMDVPFEHAARLAELETRQMELVGALDLSRHAAPAEPGPEIGEGRT
jgi:N12 class adenine-specific DNA methylase